MSRTVLVTDNDMGPAVLEREVLEPAGFDVVHLACRTEDEVLRAIQEHAPAGLLVQYAPITAAVLHGAQGVRGLVRYGVGMDNVDTTAAQEAGVQTSNVPDYGPAEVADHAVSLLLSLLRGVPIWSAATRAGAWPARGDLDDPRELRECTLGLLGFGRIAQQVAHRAQAFGMTVLTHDPFCDPARADAAGVRPVGADELWERSTAVSLHAPLDAATAGVAGFGTLGRMQPGSILVNTARAGLVDRAALEAALDDGTLAGYGADVWWQEPADPDDPLTRHPRVLLTPHVAWISPGSVRRLRSSAASRLLEMLTGTGMPA